LAWRAKKSGVGQVLAMSSSVIGFMPSAFITLG
jgi:hypothetical protein